MRIRHLAIAESLGCAQSLALQHVLLRPPRRRLTRVAAYTVGMATVGGWFTLWCVLNPQATTKDAALAFWTITTAGGLTVRELYARWDHDETAPGLDRLTLWAQGGRSHGREPRQGSHGRADGAAS